MGNRYPDLSEPVNTRIGQFKTVVLTGVSEFVKCPRCFCILDKKDAKKHALYHAEPISLADLKFGRD
jgi:hypothetical protein